MDGHLAHLPWIWNWTAAGWAAAAAWLTVVVAAVAALFARRQVLEARQTREDQAQPFVIVDFEASAASSIHLELVIRNTGTTLAKNVTFTFDPPLASTLSDSDPEFRLADSAIVTQGIPTLPPQREYRMLFERLPDRFKSALPRSYRATVRFDDARDRPHTLDYRLDLDIFFGVLEFVIYGEHDSAKALREIEKHLRKWTRPGGGVRVWTRDEDAYLHRQNESQRAEHDQIVRELGDNTPGTTAAGS